jgi:hypothetical protein
MFKIYWTGFIFLKTKGQKSMSECIRNQRKTHPLWGEAKPSCVPHHNVKSNKAEKHESHQGQPTKTAKPRTTPRPPNDMQRMNTLSTSPLQAARDVKVVPQQRALLAPHVWAKPLRRALARWALILANFDHPFPSHLGKHSGIVPNEMLNLELMPIVCGWTSCHCAQSRSSKG